MIEILTNILLGTLLISAIILFICVVVQIIRDMFSDYDF